MPTLPASATPEAAVAASMPYEDVLLAVRGIVIKAMVGRGFPRDDAEDVTQDVLERISRCPDDFAAQLDDVDHHRAYFAKMAYNYYLMRLRSERRRQRREEFHVLFAPPPNPPPEGPSVRDALELVDLAPLSALQRQYLQAVLVDHLGIDQIARARGTTTRAVHRVLQRATTAVRDFQHVGAAA